MPLFGQVNMGYLLLSQGLPCVFFNSHAGCLLIVCEFLRARAQDLFLSMAPYLAQGLTRAGTQHRWKGKKKGRRQAGFTRKGGTIQSPCERTRRVQLAGLRAPPQAPLSEPTPYPASTARADGPRSFPESSCGWLGEQS